MKTTSAQIKLCASEGLFSPFWSAHGVFVAAVSVVIKELAEGKSLLPHPRAPLRLTIYTNAMTFRWRRCVRTIHSVTAKGSPFDMQ